jgi:hypothetical protein
MAEKIPYLSASRSIITALERIKSASTPEKVTLDFVKTKLLIPGGTGNALLPFLKKLDFVSADGTPTQLYKSFRNSAESGKALAKAIKKAYKPLYEVNEYAHELSDDDLKGKIIQITGHSENSAVISFAINTFKNLCGLAKFDANEPEQKIAEAVSKIEIPIQLPEQSHNSDSRHRRIGMNLSYTINLNLPATSDISVFNAIFKSLKENLLRDETE